MFHGSAINNWYSILRNGLRNLSNTGLMKCGAAMGAGIYSANTYSTASGYAHRQHYNPNPGVGAQPMRWAHSQCANNALVGVIEVIKKKEFSKQGYGGKNSDGFGIAVVPDDNCVMLRYVWVSGAQAGTGSQ